MEAMSKHGLGFWAEIFSQFAELREKGFKQERKRAIREGKSDLICKLYRSLPLFGRKKVGRDGDIRDSLSCRNEIVQGLMRNGGYRKLNTLLPTRKGLEDEWLEIQKNLRKVNGFKIEVVEGVRGRRKMVAYSDGSRRKLC